MVVLWALESAGTTAVCWVGVMADWSVGGRVGLTVCPTVVRWALQWAEQMVVPWVCVTAEPLADCWDGPTVARTVGSKVGRTAVWRVASTDATSVAESAGTKASRKVEHWAVPKAVHLEQTRAGRWGDGKAASLVVLMAAKWGPLTAAC
jgi:hypothetical protein